MENLWTLPHWPWWQWLVLVAGGLGCGFVNTLAGGGSLLTLPLLLFLGLPPQIANATNRLALVVSTSTAAYGFRRNGITDTRTVWWLAGPALCGGLLGALLASHLPAEHFRKLFGVLLVLAALPGLFQVNLFQQKQESEAPYPPKRSLIVAFFFVGLYSGLIQVGVGIWSLLLLMTLGGYGVSHSNAIKVQLLLMTTVLASLVFLWNDEVVLVLSATLALGNATGAWLATRLLQEDSNTSWIRWLLLGCAIAAFLRTFRVL